MQAQDRIKEFRRIRASELNQNPKNWRKHPEKQKSALSGILKEVGFADALLVREVDQGYELIDGHLRTEVTPDQDVPVLVLDVNEEEADIILAFKDPICGMAETDPAALESLLADMVTGEDVLNSLVREMSEDAGIMPPDFEPVGIEEQGELDKKTTTTTCPHCGHEF